MVSQDSFLHTTGDFLSGVSLKTSMNCHLWNKGPCDWLPSYSQSIEVITLIRVEKIKVISNYPASVSDLIFP